MSSLIAVLTYNRAEVLKKLMASLMVHTPLQHTIAIFDDCSVKDNTQPELEKLESSTITPRPEIVELAPRLESTYHLKKLGAHDIHVFLGINNLGVAGNSNRAIRLFELLKEHDHLFLINDDMIVYGDAASAYAKAHKDLEIGLLCFNNLKGEAYRWNAIELRGWNVKIFERMVGAVMSITRPLFNRIGYFDTRFPKMENEHCDYNNRARLCNFINVMGKPQCCVDIVTENLLDHQHDAEPTFGGLTRQEWNRESMSTMANKVREYQQGRLHEPFTLRAVPYAGSHAGFDRGVPVAKMLGVEQAKSLIVPFD